MIAVDVQHTGTRPPALATQQRDLLVGYVLDKNSNNQQADGKAATKWIHSTFGITIGASTTWRYLRDAGFTSQLAKTKGKGYTKTDEELATELWNWLKQRRAAKQTKGLMASFDFTFTFTPQRPTSHLRATRGWSTKTSRRHLSIHQLYPDMRVERWCGQDTCAIVHVQSGIQIRSQGYSPTA